MPWILNISVYGAKTEAATSVRIASLERASFALSFDANNSSFSFFTEMYLFSQSRSHIRGRNIGGAGGA